MNGVMMRVRGGPPVGVRPWPVNSHGVNIADDLIVV